jgi:DNA-binding NarL/FixJ family response regulator
MAHPRNTADGTGRPRHSVTPVGVASVGRRNAPDGPAEGALRGESSRTDHALSQLPGIPGYVRSPGQPVSTFAMAELRPFCEPVQRDAPPFVRPTGSVDSREQLLAAKILIIDDCTLQRENLAAILGNDGNSILTGAWDLRSVCVALDEMAPDVVLLSMGTRDAITLLRAVREARPQARVIVVGISEEDETDIIACAEAGVAGYHLRTEALDELLRLISKVVDGEPACSPRVSAILLSRLSALAAQRQPGTKELGLTSREKQILRMLEMGLSNRDIADELYITLHTVKNHVHSVLSKLGVSTRAEAAAISRSFR